MKELVLQLTIEKDGDLFIVTDNVTVNYGDGSTLQLALQDYLSSLTEFCAIIGDTELMLDKTHRRLFDQLSSYCAP